MDVKLIIKKGSTRTRVLRLKSEETIIGRRAGCDLRIPSAAVSRRHCVLSYQDDCLMVEDLGSSNGTYLNGTRIQGRQLVQPGDRLGVGPVTFVVEYKLKAAAVDRRIQQDEILIPEEEYEDVALVEVLEDDEDVALVEVLEDDEDIPVLEAVEEDEPTDDLVDVPPAPRPKASRKKPDKKEKIPRKKTPPKDQPVKKDTARLEEEAAEEPILLDEEENWKLPADEDLRDLFSKMDEG